MSHVSVHRHSFGMLGLELSLNPEVWCQLDSTIKYAKAKPVHASVPRLARKGSNKPKNLHFVLRDKSPVGTAASLASKMARNCSDSCNAFAGSHKSRSGSVPGNRQSAASSLECPHPCRPRRFAQTSFLLRQSDSIILSTCYAATVLLSLA